MATVILAPPLDDGAGTYGTNADGSPVAFPVAGWTDVPGQTVSLYEDTSNALLAVASAALSPDVGGLHPGWYAWSTTVSRWSASAGALLPGATLVSSAGGLGEAGRLPVPAATAASAGGSLAYTSVEPRSLPAATLVSAGGGLSLGGRLALPAGAATSSAGAVAWIQTLPLPAATMTMSTGGITAPDSTAPTISSFAVPSTASSTSLTGISAGATDDVGVTGYIIKEVANGASAPTAVAADCTATTGISAGALSSSTLTFTASTTGARDFYLFVRDAAGNVTRSTVSTCTIAASGPSLIDDFSTNTIASYTKTGNAAEAAAITVTGGKLRATNVGVDDSTNNIVYRTGSSLQDGAVELTVRFDADNGANMGAQADCGAGVVFRYIDGTHYLVARFVANSLCLFQANGGGEALLGSAYSFTVTTGVDRVLHVDFSGANVTVKLDGTTRITVSNAAVTGAGAYGAQFVRGVDTDGETYWTTMAGTFYVDDLKAG